MPVNIRIPIVTLLDSRDVYSSSDLAIFTKDTFLKNCVIDTMSGSAADNINYIVRKRPAVSAWNKVTAGAARAAHSPSTTTVGNSYQAYIVVGSSVWNVYGTSAYHPVTAVTGSLTNSTGVVYINDIYSDYIIILEDGSDGWIVQNTGSPSLSKITDADFPTTTRVGPAAQLNGYVFVMDTSGNIWNSNLDDATAWDATDYIQANRTSGPARGLFTYKDYIVSCRADSMEFFYDAGNASGSPLSRVSGAFINVGIANGKCIVRTEDDVYVVAQDKSHKYVARLNGFELEKVSNRIVDEVLSKEAHSAPTMYELFFFGRSFLCLQVDGDSAYSANGLTLLYDTLTKQWQIITSYDDDTSTSYSFVGKVGGVIQNYKKRSFVVGATDGSLYYINENATQDTKIVGSAETDETKSILLEVQTSPYDGGTNSTKFLDMLELIGPVASTSVAVKWTDDLYSNFSTARTTSLSSRTPLRRCGQFSRRAFNIKHTAAEDFRLSSIDMLLSGGAFSSKRGGDGT